MRATISFIGLLLTSLVTSTVQAGVINVQQYSGFLHSSSLGATSLEHSAIGYNVDELSSAGVTTTFTNGLDAENLGAVTWSFVNNTGSALTDAWFFVFLDAEVDQAINTFFNESGALTGVNGTGAGDIQPDSWEIDEPGYVFGDIYDNLLAGYLDNSNGVPTGAEDDVSLALGFSLGDLADGATVTVQTLLSRLLIGGLNQVDADSGESLYFNGTAVVQNPTPVEVSEPASTALLLMSLLFAGFARRKSRLS